MLRMQYEIFEYKIDNSRVYSFQEVSWGVSFGSAKGCKTSIERESCTFNMGHFQPSR